MIDPEGAPPPHSAPTPAPAPPATPAPRFVPFDDARWVDAIRDFNARIATVAPQFSVRDQANPVAPVAGRIPGNAKNRSPGRTLRLSSVSSRTTTSAAACGSR